MRSFSSLVEIRECHLKPSCAGAYLKMAEAIEPLRKQLMPLRLFAVSDTGGVLNTAFHFYCYPSLQNREDVTKTMRESVSWTIFESDSNPFCDKQISNIYAEAPFVTKEGYGGMGVERPGDNSSATPAAIYEIRRYQLVLGYETMPRFFDYYSSGLKSKLEVSQEAGSHFCTLLYNEVGSGNEVMELWRHKGVTGMVQSRVLSRQSQPWKKAIAEIAPLAVSFSNMLLKPTSFSNWSWNHWHCATFSLSKWHHSVQKKRGFTCLDLLATVSTSLNTTPNIGNMVIINTPNGNMVIINNHGNMSWGYRAHIFLSFRRKEKRLRKRVLLNLSWNILLHDYYIKYIKHVMKKWSQAKKNAGGKTIDWQ